MKALEVLNLSKNNITEIEEHLSFLSQLKLLNMTQNPIDEEILKKLDKKTKFEKKLDE